MPSDESEERPKSNKRYSDTYKGGKSRSKARTGGKKGYGKNYAGGKSRAYSDSRDDDEGNGRGYSRDYSHKRDYSRDRDKDRRKGYDRDRSRKDYERKDRRDSKPSKNGEGKKGKYERTRTRAGLGADVATTVLTGSSELGGLAGKAVDYARYKSSEETVKRYKREAEESRAKADAMKQARLAREEEEAERQRIKDAKEARKKAKQERWERAKARDEKLKQAILDRKSKREYKKAQKKLKEQYQAESELISIGKSEPPQESAKSESKQSKLGMYRDYDPSTDGPTSSDISKQSSTTKKSWFKRKG